MLARAVALLAPPRCGGCAGTCTARAAICDECERWLRRQAPIEVNVPVLERTLAAAAYDGPARALVAALKFGNRLQLARPMARAIAAAAEPLLAEATIVPVPPAPRRARRRGFDPADRIATSLARQLDIPMARCLARANGPRQVGRRRRERLAEPPRVRLVATAPQRPVLVDDVITTGATLAACALALRGADSDNPAGVAFACALDRDTQGQMRR